MKITTSLKSTTYPLPRAASLFIAGTILAALFLASPSAHALEADPSHVTFEDTATTIKINLTHEGAPLTTADFKGYDLLVGKHTYEYMVTVKPVEGGVEVTPTEMAEVGSYNLVLRTTHGDITVQVYTPLSNVETSLNTRAEALGITVEELKKRMGLGAEPFGRERVTFNLPAVVYVGENVALRMSTAADRHFEWRLNGEVIQEGDGAHTFSHTFSEPGLYALELRESVNGAVLATGRSMVTVIAEKPVTGAVERGASLEFLAPEGYETYKWTIDGKAKGDDPVLQCKLRKPGLYSINVEARSNGVDGSDDYREVAYRILVI